MDALLALVGQIGRIVAGYVAACAAAGLFATVAVLMNAPALGASPGFDVLVQFLLLGWFGTTLIALPVALIPAAVFVVLGEGLKLTSPILYVIAGAVVALLPTILHPTPATDTQPVQFSFDFVALFFASGVAGGFVYWMIAGRRAGRWQAEFVLHMD